MIIESIEEIECVTTVYDLETEAGTFLGGGMKTGIMLKNTDSCHNNFLDIHPDDFVGKQQEMMELVFKRESLTDTNLQFDENFGLGAKFFMGEEAIFVSDGIKKGLKIGFIPEKLLSHSQPSTGHKTLISEVYYVQSAVFYRIFGKMQLFWIALKLFFDLKQSKISFSEVGHLFKQAQKGKEAYVNATKL